MNLLVRHWELKLLALAFSTALWFFVMTSEKSDLVVSAPVELDGIPLGLRLAAEVPDSVDVQLHGLRVTLARLSPDQVRARLSLTGAQAGETVIRLLPEQVSVPPGVTVLRVNPSRIRVVLAPAAPPGEAREPRS